MTISTAKSTSETLKPRLLGLALPALTEILAGYGEPAFRAAQIYDWLYKKKAVSFDEMKNLPASLRGRLSADWEVGRAEPRSVSESADGTKKYLFVAPGGKFIESAYIPEPDRATLCVSTQVGCKMGCLFCATGRQGFQGQLDAGAVVNQFLSLPERDRITNIVYMGMGEPLDNPEGTFGSL